MECTNDVAIMSQSQEHGECDEDYECGRSTHERQQRSGERNRDEN